MKCRLNELKLEWRDSMFVYRLTPTLTVIGQGPEQASPLMDRLSAFGCHG
jgi:hypothetical protein